MRIGCRRSVLIALFLLALTARPVLADDEQDVRKVLGPDAATCMIEGNWAMGDVGSLEKGTAELVLLRRYKGEWRKMTSTGNFSPMEMIALGVPVQTARNFGLGEVPPEIVRSLHNSVKSEGLKHASFNVVTFQGGFMAFTASNPRKEGIQVWYSPGKGWKKLFFVDPNLDQAAVDGIFAKNGVPLFLEYRVLIQRANN